MQNSRDSFQKSFEKTYVNILFCEFDKNLFCQDRQKMKNDIKQKKYTDKPLLRVVHKRQHQTGGGVPKDDITYKVYLVKVMRKWRV